MHEKKLNIIHKALYVWRQLQTFIFHDEWRCSRIILTMNTHCYGCVPEDVEECALESLIPDER
jgi:hypothetical protein